MDIYPPSPPRTNAQQKQTNNAQPSTNHLTASIINADWRTLKADSRWPPRSPKADWSRKKSGPTPWNLFDLGGDGGGDVLCLRCDELDGLRRRRFLSKFRFDYHWKDINRHLLFTCSPRGAWVSEEQVGETGCGPAPNLSVRAGARRWRAGRQTLYTHNLLFLFFSFFFPFPFFHLPSPSSPSPSFHSPLFPRVSIQWLEETEWNEIAIIARSLRILKGDQDK